MIARKKHTFFSILSGLTIFLLTRIGFAYRVVTMFGDNAPVWLYADGWEDGEGDVEPPVFHQPDNMRQKIFPAPARNRRVFAVGITDQRRRHRDPGYHRRLEGGCLENSDTDVFRDAPFRKYRH